MAILLLVPLVLAVTGCAIVRNQADTGPTRTETRDVTGFTQVEVGGGAKVTITIGSGYRVSLTADDHVLKVLESRLEGDRLVIDSRTGYTTSVTVKVDITMPDLTGLTLSGGTHGDVGTLAGHGIALKVSGGSQLTIRGQAESVTIEASGGSQAHLRDLRLDSATVQASGGSEIELASPRVEGSASGGSQVDVWDAEMLAVETSGGSEVNRH